MQAAGSQAPTPLGLSYLADLTAGRVSLQDSSKLRGEIYAAFTLCPRTLHLNRFFKVNTTDPEPTLVLLQDAVKKAGLCCAY